MWLVQSHPIQNSNPIAMAHHSRNPDDTRTPSAIAAGLRPFSGRAFSLACLFMAGVSIICTIPVRAQPNNGGTQAKQELSDAERLIIDTYRHWRQRIIDQSDKADFTALRNSFAQLSDAGWRVDQGRIWQDKMFRAQERQDFAQCLMHAQSALEQDYTSLEAHYGAMVCAFQLNQMDSGLHHQWVVRGLVESLQGSGRGDLSQEPYQAINLAEVDAYLRLMGYEVRQRVSTERDGLGLEVITIYDADAQRQRQLFFRFAQLAYDVPPSPANPDELATPLQQATEPEADEDGS